MDFDGAGAVGGVVITQLALVVTAHGPEGTATLDKEGVIVACPDAGDA